MNFYIKEWPDNTATLMTDRGRVVWTFASVEEAEEAAQDCGRTTERRNRSRTALTELSHLRSESYNYLS